MTQTNTIVALQQVLYHGYRLDPQFNEVNEAMDINKLEATGLGKTTRVYEPGLKGYAIAFGGFYDPQLLDSYLFDQSRVKNLPVTWSMTDGTLGSPARSFKAQIADRTVLDGNHGELAKARVGFATNDRVVLGRLLYNTSATGNVTGSTAVQLGAVLSTETIYASLHVFSGTGNFTVKIQSDDNSGFTSATDRITFTQVGTASPIASEWASLAGAITDDYWRIVATNPNTRDFAVFAGIQTTAL